MPVLDLNSSWPFSTPQSPQVADPASAIFSYIYIFVLYICNCEHLYVRTQGEIRVYVRSHVTGVFCEPIILQTASQSEPVESSLGTNLGRNIATVASLPPQLSQSGKRVNQHCKWVKTMCANPRQDGSLWGYCGPERVAAVDCVGLRSTAGTST